MAAFIILFSIIGFYVYTYMFFSVCIFFANIVKTNRKIITIIL